MGEKISTERRAAKKTTSGEEDRGNPYCKKPRGGGCKQYKTQGKGHAENQESGPNCSGKRKANIVWNMDSQTKNQKEGKGHESQARDKRQTESGLTQASRRRGTTAG